jgi:hypothetical protein
MAKEYDYGKESKSRSFVNLTHGLALYTADLIHQWQGSAYNLDCFLEMESTLTGIGITHADLLGAKTVASVLFDGELRSIADGGNLCIEYFMLLGNARWTDQVAGAQEASTHHCFYHFPVVIYASLLVAGSKRLNIMASR